MSLAIPNEEQRKCPVCDDRKQIFPEGFLCPECHGYGGVDASVVCPHCDGYGDEDQGDDGEWSCSMCTGSGRMLRTDLPAEPQGE